MRDKILAVLLTMAAIAQPAAAWADACLKYAPKKVTLTGIIFLKEDFGPPGYGQDPEHDTREMNVYINLDTPVCVEAKGDQAAAHNVGTMQMVYARYPFQKKWAGKHVEVKGTLFAADTGHHWTPVLITATQTREIP